MSLGPNLYSNIYAVGYYYGRTYNGEPETYPEEDICFINKQAFKDGMEAGKRDYQMIELAAQALAATPAV